MSNFRRTMQVAVVFMVMSSAFSVYAKIASVNEPVTEAKPLKVLRKIYFVVHPLYWIDIERSDPRSKDRGSQEFPGKYELVRRREFQLQSRYEKLILQAKEDEGMFFMPSSSKACAELVELARKHFGPRLVVLEDKEGYKFDRDMNHIRKLLGPDLAKKMDKELREDRLQAIKKREFGWDKDNMELGCWGWTNAWAYFFNKNLKEQGYTYDPAVVEFEALGENWHGCAATYPILMGRALNLAKPVNRRFDLINPDGSPILLKAELVEQNIPMPGDIRLFIFKTADEGPTWGNYVAQFFEGKHGIMDRPRVVEVDFPFYSVTEITGFGWSKGRSEGIYDKRHGLIEMSVGYGGHFYHPATLVMAMENLPFEKFRAALLAGKVKDKPGEFKKLGRKIYTFFAQKLYRRLKKMKMMSVYYKLRGVKDKIASRLN